MSRWHDILDWVGGYPYEFATPDAIFDFYRARGFTLTRMACGGVGLGCNEVVFQRTGAGQPSERLAGGSLREAVKRRLPRGRIFALRQLGNEFSVVWRHRRSVREASRFLQTVRFA